jgi:hypothetical protein
MGVTRIRALERSIVTKTKSKNSFEENGSCGLSFSAFLFLKGALWETGVLCIFSIRLVVLKSKCVRSIPE